MALETLAAIPILSPSLKTSQQSRAGSAGEAGKPLPVGRRDAKPARDISPIKSPLRAHVGAAGPGAANIALASARAPSPRCRRRAGRGSQKQILLLKGDGDSAVPSLVCAAGPSGCSTRISGGCPEQHSDPRNWYSPARPRGKTPSQHRAQLPRQLCCPNVPCNTSPSLH